jgi:hypothetical protein
MGVVNPDHLLEEYIGKAEKILNLYIIFRPQCGLDIL